MANAKANGSNRAGGESPRDDEAGRGWAATQEDVMETATARDAGVVRTSIVGIVANVLLAAFKAAVGLLSNSIAIVLDAVNNLSDAASSLITIVGTKLAGRKPDRDHPYGHGRIEYITTTVIAAIVLWAGVTSLQESAERIINPQEPSYSAIALVIVAVAVGAKIVLGLYTRKRGEALNSGSLVASGTDALMDSIISAATLVAAFVFIFTGVSLEAWLGAVISLVIIKAGVDMLREAVSKIVGERVDPELSRSVKATVAGIDGVLGAYDLLLEDYGPDRFWGSVHVEVPDAMRANEIDRLSRTIQMTVYQEYGIILHTVGIYAQNTGNDDFARMRRDVYDLAEANGDVLEVHGFYGDEKAKRVSFDLVVSFDAEDRHAVVEKVRSIMSRRYPDYTFAVTLDSDISD